MATTPNPYAVTTLEMSTAAVTDPSSPTIGRRFQVFVGCILAYLAIGTVVACIEIESIVGTGPVLFGIGLILIWLTRSGRQSGFRFLAFACLGFPILCFFLINVFEWSPDDAAFPIGLLTVLFTAVVTVWGVVALRRHRVSVVAEVESGFSPSLSAQSSETDRIDEAAAK